MGVCVCVCVILNGLNQNEGGLNIENFLPGWPLGARLAGRQGRAWFHAANTLVWKAKCRRSGIHASFRELYFRVGTTNKKMAEAQEERRPFNSAHCFFCTVAEGLWGTG